MTLLVVAGALSHLVGSLLDGIMGGLHGLLLLQVPTPAPPGTFPINLSGMFSSIRAFILTIVGGLGGIFFLIKAAKHAFGESRDPSAAGWEFLYMVVLLAVAVKGDAVITWALALIS